MLKILGSIMIVGAASVIGLTASARLSSRCRVLSSLARALNIMNSEICELLTPLDELIFKLSDIAPEPTDLFFKDCYSEMKKNKDVPFAIVWSKSISRATYLGLRPMEKQVLSELGATLGRYSADEQSRAILHAARAMESAASVAEAESLKQGKVYGRLGIICGIAIVIVFI